MTKTIEDILAELCDEQQLRGKAIQGVSMQKSYDEWVRDGHPSEGPDHAQLHLVFQWGIQYAVDALAEKMGAYGYESGDGSESLEGDLSITIDNVFRKAGFEHENGDVMCVTDIQMKMNT